MAIQVAFFPVAMGLLQGLRITEAQGLSPDWFKEAVLELNPTWTTTARAVVYVRQAGACSRP